MLLLLSCNESQPPTETNQIGTPPTIDTEQPPRYYSYDFDSYDEFLSQFDVNANVSDSLFLSELPMTSKLNQNFVSYMSDLEVIELPRRNGELMDLYEITYFTREGRFDDLPCIWYHCLYNNNEVRVQITYPSVAYNTADFPKLHTSEILRILSPDDSIFGKIEDFDYKNYLQGRYKNIYRTDLELLDKKVTAVVYEYKENNKIDIYFYYHNAMVWITSKSDVLNEEFFKSFSLG